MTTPAAPTPDLDGLTPMMAHYLELKRDNPGCLLFYRLGDFYEMFFEDAEIAARALDITLTRRGKKGGGEDIPMAGVPAHAVDAYLARLIRQGLKVAICDQMEDPAEAKKRGAKSIRREITRVVTPGTLTEDGLLEARRNNHLIALTSQGASEGAEAALARVDLSTGDMAAETLGPGGLGAALSRLEPAEILIPEKLLKRPDWFETLAEWKTKLTPLPDARFHAENGRKRLLALFDVATLDAFGAFSTLEVAAAGALADYVVLTQRGKVPALQPLRRDAAGSALEIDAAAARSLELWRTQAGERKGSLLHVIDRTRSGGGARLLATWLAGPLVDPAAIAQRQDMVGHLVDGAELRERVQARLAAAPDLERPLARLSLGRGGPRDLAAIRDGLSAAADLREMLFDRRLPDPPPGLIAAAEGMRFDAGLVERLGRALAADLPLNMRDGGFIAAGYTPDLDQLRSLRDDSRRTIAQMQAEYARISGVSTLKIKHNAVIGYFVEVGAAHADKMKAPFIHRQSMAGAVRFTTTELAELDAKIARAGDQALALELALFADLAKECLDRAASISGCARAMALLDGVAGLAELAAEQNYVRPLVDDSLSFRIEGGRHPVVEATLPEGPRSFTPNDCDLAPDQRLWLLTGPNMAGKSTFLRQNALIAVLAQMGSFVPAAAAHIGGADRLFSRVGAADDLARGRSTFMVEMVETAAILNRATPRSLVILDEIGRGTATYDGVSIAWATVEHLHNVCRCRGLFATHYHELTALAGRLDALSCWSMRVKEWKGKVVFLHEVAAGAADRSYGVHVARLAGMPGAVVARAQQVLNALEQGEAQSPAAALADDLPLFRAAVKAVPPPQPAPSPEPAAPEPAPAEPHPLETALAAIDPDALTPRQALEALYALKSV